MNPALGPKQGLTHFDEKGQARMVDVSSKDDTKREAVAEGIIFMSHEAFARIREGTVSKGDVLGVARIAGIMAAKKVHELIPLAHPLPIHKVEIAFTSRDENSSILIRAEVAVSGKTGVEMEALTAVTIAGLTIYDMCKSMDKGMELKNIKLLSKKGGKSGDYERGELAAKFTGGTTY